MATATEEVRDNRKAENHYDPPVTDRGNKDMNVLTIYVEKELHKRLKAKCALEGISMTAIIQDLIKKYVEKGS